MTRSISNSDDVVYSRDIIERIEELQDEISREEISEDNGATPQVDEDGETKIDVSTCGTCGKSWNDALISASTPAPSGRCPYEHIHEEIEELKILESLAEEGEQNAGDWKHGATLIRESYFEDYARELARDIGAISGEEKWPLNCIDWEKAARELQYDYSTIDFDGVNYLVRS